MKRVNAIFYDGHSARQQSVTLNIVDGLLEVHGDAGVLDIPLSAMRISEKLGNTPRLLHFAEGGHCEIQNHADFEALLQESGVRPQSLISRLENSLPYALAATLMAVAFVFASYFWGLPWFADIAAKRIPARVTLNIDRHFLQVIDKNLMQPSQLSTERQQALQHRFDSLHNEHGIPAHRLEFRSSNSIGANAFALPGGTIVITDQLVKLADNDEEILAVLAHELGHVSERHPLRQLLQSSVVGLAMTWYLSDISSLLATAPTLLLESNYSRNFERRADHYAADMLLMNHISPASLADMLQKLEAAHADRKQRVSPRSRIAELFSTHPDTAERIRALRNYPAH
jgi:Zn-dependent protease with chaperone function